MEGKLFFSKNGKVFPVAYEDPNFMKHELYPACCCLMNGEKFTLINPMPED